MQVVHRAIAHREHSSWLRMIVIFSLIVSTFLVDFGQGRDEQARLSLWAIKHARIQTDNYLCILSK